MLGMLLAATVLLAAAVAAAAAAVAAAVAHGHGAAVEEPGEPGRQAGGLVEHGRGAGVALVRGDRRKLGSRVAAGQPGERARVGDEAGAEQVVVRRLRATTEQARTE